MKKWNSSSTFYRRSPTIFAAVAIPVSTVAEEKCPHAAHVQPVIQAMRGADGLIFATPVYVMDMTAQMKAFLDHTGYFYMVHRPYPEMFQKSALVVSTAAGAGTKDANASVIRSLKHWASRRIYSCGISIFARVGCHSCFPQTENRKTA